LAQTIASNLEAVIEPAAVLAVAVAPGVRAELAELAAQGVREALVALAVQVVPAVQVAPVARVVPAVPELAIVQAVARVQVIVQAEEGLELGPAAEPAVDPAEAQVLVQVAAPARIKSATAVHRHGQVRVPKRVEDLAAAAAETTRAPAATEAATAWAAAV
jgi:hypothetical protein